MEHYSCDLIMQYLSEEIRSISEDGEEVITNPLPNLKTLKGGLVNPGMLLGFVKKRRNIRDMTQLSLEVNNTSNQEVKSLFFHIIESCPKLKMTIQGKLSWVA